MAKNVQPRYVQRSITSEAVLKDDSLGVGGVRCSQSEAALHSLRLPLVANHREGAGAKPSARPPFAVTQQQLGDVSMPQGSHAPAHRLAAASTGAFHADCRNAQPIGTAGPALKGATPQFLKRRCCGLKSGGS